MNCERLKEIRIYYDKTQKEMAEILNVSRSTYSGWENGRGNLGENGFWVIDGVSVGCPVPDD